MESDKLQFGEVRPAGGTTCDFGLKAPECPKAATRHFMWLADKTTSAACDEHAAYIHSKITSDLSFDEHTHEGNCGMPGTMWHHPYEDEKEGYCFFPFLDDAELLAEEVVLQSI